MSPVNRRDQGIRAALAGEQPVKRLVAVCAYCPDHLERTAAARAHGHDVTHQTCEPCNRRLNAQIDAIAAQRASAPHALEAQQDLRADDMKGAEQNDRGRWR